MAIKSSLKNNSPMPGFSLMELLVAMALSGMVVTLVFFSWNHITHHTITQRQKSMFQAEAVRVSEAIAGEIRKSPEVLSWKDNAITFIAPNGVDTVTYEQMYNGFMKNGTPLPLIVPGAFVSQFTVEPESPADALDASKTVMLSISLTMQDNFGNSSVIPLQLRVNAPSDQTTDGFSKGLR